MHHADKLITADDEAQAGYANAVRFTIKREYHAVDGIDVQEFRFPFDDFTRDTIEVALTPKERKPRTVTNKAWPTTSSSIEGTPL